MTKIFSISSVDDDKAFTILVEITEILENLLTE